MIKYCAASKQFHLSNEHISYVMQLMENGQLGQLYYGKKIRDRESFSYLQELINRPFAVHSGDDGSILPLQYVRQEYPGYGTGDFRFPAYRILQEKGSMISGFRYESHRILKGKPSLEPLPSLTLNNEDEAETLEVCFFDSVTQTRLTLCYTLFTQLPVITRHAVFTQEGAQPVTLLNAMSTCLDLPDMHYDMLHFSGAWGRERQQKIRKLEVGIQSISSMRGSSSAEHNPSFLLKRPHTDEMQGEAVGFSFMYSGSFLAQVEVSSHEETRILLGIHPENFNWTLAQGEQFTTPEAIMVYSDSGLNALSQTFHTLFLQHLGTNPHRNSVRPILLNNWEATYMDFTEESILSIARKAQEAGVELFVLDDGWFGTRDDDTQGLGDWYPNKAKLPDGLSGLSKKITAMGMRFGFWIEPEMINMQSELYNQHPDWLLTDPERRASPSRNQYVLDFSRPEVVAYLYDRLSALIKETGVSYIKWDMNRNITECFSQTAGAADQGKVMHRYILGVYALYTQLTKNFPHILFESCASGGGRFDPALLAFAPQAWCSDNTDAGERCMIQYGTSYFYPISSMGAHVSAVPNQQTGRSCSMSFRSHVAFYGAFGYELDLNRISEKEFEEVKQQIVFYKKTRDVFQFGTFYRLVSPFDTGNTGWISVAADKKTAYAAYYQRLHRTNYPGIRFKLAGLDPAVRYRVRAEQYDREHFGDELMYAGLLIARETLLAEGGDFSSVLFEITAV
ncbi:MAG: alpha-galactosidase [Treponema sp.]